MRLIRDKLIPNRPKTNSAREIAREAPKTSPRRCLDLPVTTSNFMKWANAQGDYESNIVSLPGDFKEVPDPNLKCRALAHISGYFEFKSVIIQGH